MSYFLPDSFQAFLPDLIQLLYLVATGFFIVGIKRLGSPATARFGNRLASIGMLIGVAVTLFDREIVTFEFIIAGVVIGALIGVFSARKVQISAMPALVAILNGLGGGAAALVACGEVNRINPQLLDQHVLATPGLSILYSAG